MASSIGKYKSSSPRPLVTICILDTLSQESDASAWPKGNMEDFITLQFFMNQFISQIDMHAQRVFITPLPHPLSPSPLYQTFCQFQKLSAMSKHLQKSSPTKINTSAINVLIPRSQVLMTDTPDPQSSRWSSQNLSPSLQRWELALFAYAWNTRRKAEAGGWQGTWAMKCLKN